MIEDPDEFVLRVFVCPKCSEAVFSEPGARLVCGICDRELIDTGETVVVDKDGNVLAVN